MSPLFYQWTTAVRLLTRVTDLAMSRITPICDERGPRAGCGAVVLIEALDTVLDDAEAHLDEVESGHAVDGSLHCPLHQISHPLSSDGPKIREKDTNCSICLIDKL